MQKLRSSCYRNKSGNTVITDELKDKRVTVYSYPNDINNLNHILKPR